MTALMPIDPTAALPVTHDAVRRDPPSQSFGAVMASAADALAATVASGKASIAEAAIARAKADVMLEVAAVAASRVSGSITTLLQTQV